MKLFFYSLMVLGFAIIIAARSHSWWTLIDEFFLLFFFAELLTTLRSKLKSERFNLTTKQQGSSKEGRR